MLDVARLHPSEVFAGRYRVERLLKAGGMGAVYVAEHTATRKRVALKLMRPEIVGDESARARFAQEAQVSGLIDSVHVVDVYDAGVDDATQAPFIAMELLAGAELGERVRERGRMEPTEVVEIVAQAARGLDRAHDAGVVHRDLKPENLFLAVRDGDPPRVKILDFGIAKFLAGTGASTTSATGTPMYMAPEQLSTRGVIGPTTDVWALGLIAYVLLTASPYWEATDIASLYGEILAGDYEAPSARARRAGVELPPAFDAWFFRCVDPDPARRFARASEAAQRLAQAFGVTRAESSPLVDVRATSPIDPASRAPTPLELATTIGSNPSIALRAPVVGARPLAEAPAAGATSSPKRKMMLATAAAAVVGALAVVALRGRGAANGPTIAIAQVDLGLSDTTCTVDARGAVRCVGSPLAADGAPATSSTVDTKGPAAAIAVGKRHACARMVDGTVECWGDNVVGQLGDGTTKSRGPMPVPGLHGVVQVASGYHGACARLGDGTVKCWGGNKYGQVGDGTTVDRLAPVSIDGAKGATSIALGQDHACALFAGGVVRCWGRNTDGELGDGTTFDRTAPTEVLALRGAVALALGGHFSCAKLEDGTASCWGTNANGELGDGTTAPLRAKPAPVVGIEGVAHLAMGTWHGCALTAHGALSCWGQNSSGQIGDGSTTPRTVPVAVAGVFAQVAAGRAHTCAVRKGGKLECWGKNDSGQLCDGTTTHRLEPARE